MEGRSTFMPCWEASPSHDLPSLSGTSRFNRPLAPWARFMLRLAGRLPKCRLMMALLNACRGLAARCARAGRFNAFQNLRLLGCQPGLSICLGLLNGGAHCFMRCQSTPFKPADQFHVRSAVAHGGPGFVIEVAMLGLVLRCEPLQGLGWILL